jgi:hypothetical protein
MALPGITDANTDAILKKTYASQMKSMLYSGQKRFLLGSIKKTIGGGESFTVPVEFGENPGRSITFANALANRGKTTKVKFSMDWTENHAQAIVRNTDVSLSKGIGGVVNLKMNEIKGATTTLANSVEKTLIKSGFNEYGQILTVAGAVVTFASRGDTNAISPGQAHVAANAINAASLKAPTVPPVVLSVDRDAGVVTYTASVATGTAWANGDYVFQQGDQLGSATPTAVIGIGGWIPLVAPAGIDIGGVDRSVMPQQLAGIRLDGRGKSAKEAVFDLVTRVADAGGEPDVILASNDFVGRLVKEIEGTTTYMKTEATDAEGPVGIFYESVQLMGPAGPLKVQGHPFMYSDRVFALTMESWEIKTAGEGGSKDIVYNNTWCSTSSPMIDDPSGDNQIARLKALLLLVCNAPSHNGVTQIA